MDTSSLMEQILSNENLNQAYLQVVRNKGAEGVDGMKYTELKEHLAENGELIREQFHNHSYGFRPNRCAQHAILKALDMMNDGYEWIVDIDLEKFFDTVNHDKLMTLIGRTIKDGDVISIIRKFLVSGIMIDDEYEDSVIGTPQGGNLSPLLANIMLNELDKEMEKLGLKVNMTKSKIDKPRGLKYLGFGFYYDSHAKQYKAKPHQISVQKFKMKMKKLTSRKWGVSNSYKVEKLNQLIRGWVNYFKIGSMKKICAKLDGSIRYRLRMCIWKHWKTPKNRAKNLMKLGLPKWCAKRTAYINAYAKVCRTWDVQQAISNERLTQFGLISMLDYYTQRCVNC